jgi:hypothetical protein
MLAVRDGQVIEYDAECLAPLGVVVKQDELENRELVLVDGGKVAMLVGAGENGEMSSEVIQPNDDGSYWRKFQRNKMRRIQEKQREEIAKAFMDKLKKPS